MSAREPGHPEKLAAALIQAYEMAEPPLHLFLGSDAVGRAEAKQAEMQRAIAEQRALWATGNRAVASR